MREHKFKIGERLFVARHVPEGALSEDCQSALNIK
jgi:hypothetical protein